MPQIPSGHLDTIKVRVVHGAAKAIREVEHGKLDWITPSTARSSVASRVARCHRPSRSFRPTGRATESPPSIPTTWPRRRLIAAANPSVRDITLWTYGEPGKLMQTEVAMYFAAVLDELGFTVHVRVLTLGRYFTLMVLTETN